MNTWAPLFSKIVDSSIWCEPDFVVKVFLTMMAKKDSDHVCRGSAFNIGQWAKKTEDETLEALRILSEPDRKRKEPQPFEGRRIQKVEEGWLILNGQYYENLMRKANRREYKTEKQREYRTRPKRQSNGGPRTQERIAEGYEKAGQPELAERVAGMGAEVPVHQPSAERPVESHSVDPGLAAAGFWTVPDLGQGQVDPAPTAISRQTGERPKSPPGSSASSALPEGLAPGPEFLG